VCLVLAASFPAAVVIVPLTSEENKNTVLAAEIVTFTTVLSLIIIPLAASFLIGVYGISS
jgi:predicted permease